MQTIVENQLSLGTVEVDQTRFDLAVLVFHILEIQRDNLTLGVGGDHSTRDTSVEQLLHAIAQQGAIGQVIAVRLHATDTVANLNRTALHAEAEQTQTLLQQQVEDMSLAHVAQLRMTVFIVGESHTRLLNLGIRHEVEHTLADDDDAIFHTQQLTLDDGAIKEEKKAQKEKEREEKEREENEEKELADDNEEYLKQKEEEEKEERERLEREKKEKEEKEEREREEREERERKEREEKELREQEERERKEREERERKEREEREREEREERERKEREEREREEREIKEKEERKIRNIIY